MRLEHHLAHVSTMVDTCAIISPHIIIIIIINNEAIYNVNIMMYASFNDLQFQ